MGSAFSQNVSSTVFVQSQGVEDTLLEVAVGRNATLNCTSNENVKWEIVESDGQLLIAYLNVPPEAQEKGFTLEKPPDREVKRMQVLGLVENNQTEVKCKKLGGEIIISYKLNVIGNCPIIVENSISKTFH